MDYQSQSHLQYSKLSCELYLAQYRLKNRIIEYLSGSRTSTSNEPRAPGVQILGRFTLCHRYFLGIHRNHLSRASTIPHRQHIRKKSTLRGIFGKVRVWRKRTVAMHKYQCGVCACVRAPSARSPFWVIRSEAIFPPHFSSSSSSSFFLSCFRSN